MRAAQFDVSTTMLEQLLNMPAGAYITHIHMSTANTAQLTVTDPALPEADEPHRLSPVVIKSEVRWDWGIA